MADLTAIARAAAATAFSVAVVGVGAEALALAPSSNIGGQATVTRPTVCAPAPNECHPLPPTGRAGGFYYPASVVYSPKSGTLYVAEIGNDRVQEITAAGTFVSMFGWGVNETKNRLAGASRAERSVCAAGSNDLCTAGVPGSGAGQMDSPASVAVDPVTGDVYVLDILPGDVRLDKYTSGGRFLSRIGGAMKPSAQSGDLLAVGGPGDLLYVGDEHRVQVFGADGGWRREISLASLSAAPHSSVVALALGTGGELYVVYRAGEVENYLVSERADIVHVFDRHGEQIDEFPVDSRRPYALDSIDAMAMSPSGELAVMGAEIGGLSSSGRMGLLYDARTGRPIAELPVPPDNEGIAFDGVGALYVTTAVNNYVVNYVPALLPGFFGPYTSGVSSSASILQM